MNLKSEQRHEDDLTLNAFAIGFEHIPLSHSSCTSCPSATNRGTTDCADDAIVGWQELAKLSCWTATADSAPDHDSAEYSFALALSPGDQRCLHPVWKSDHRKTRHRRAHDCARGSNGGGNRPDDASRFHDRRTSRASCFLCRTGWTTNYYQ
jgi:hypothetical protein